MAEMVRDEHMGMFEEAVAKIRAAHDEARAIRDMLSSVEARLHSLLVELEKYAKR